MSAAFALPVDPVDVSDVILDLLLLDLRRLMVLPPLASRNCEVMACATFFRRCFRVCLSRYASSEGAVLYNCSSSFRALYGSSLSHFVVGFCLRSRRSCALPASKTRLGTSKHKTVRLFVVCLHLHLTNEFSSVRNICDVVLPTSRFFLATSVRFVFGESA